MSDFANSSHEQPTSPRDRDRDRPVMSMHPGSTIVSSVNGMISSDDRARSPVVPSRPSDSHATNIYASMESRRAPGQHQHQNASNPEHVTLRALVSTKEAGVIIGKSGANIKAIRDESNARVNISEHIPGVHERILSITGAIEEVAKAYAQVSRGLNSGDLRSATADAVEATPLTLRYLIPNSRMGSVIGKGGARIKEIQDESNARLAAQPQPLPHSHDRLLEMIGVPDAIHIATYHMLVTIKEHSDRPLNDRPYRPEYGAGMTMPSTTGPSGTHHAAGATASVPYHGGHVMSGGGSGGAYQGGSHYAPSAHGSGAQSDGMYYSGGLAGAGGSAYGIAGGIDAKETRTFYCPPSKVGSMIGKGGAKINRIRTESGCRITVEDPRGERADRPFIVMGPPAAVDKAIAILEQSLRRELQRDAQLGQTQPMGTMAPSVQSSSVIQ